MHPLDRVAMQRGSLEGAEPISKALSLKADKEDVEQLLICKADKMAAIQLEEKVDKVISQIHHVIVVLTESIKLNVSKAQETKLAHDNRAKLLLKQVQVLSSWAMKTQKSPRNGGRKHMGSQIENSPRTIGHGEILLKDFPMPLFDPNESMFSEASEERESILINAADTLRRSLVVSREFPLHKIRHSPRKVIRNNIEDFGQTLTIKTPEIMIDCL